MHLERIEISGFKSFAEKTNIIFDKGVTAVVGPNGSGKSNLSEAIKWVLGEQSAKSLRGKKMDDIIFAGSQTRKPINIAEVTLVLNNEDRFLPLDFSQIQLTRRLNRNGESECFINKKPCRLKDIVNLLMDSGLGKDSFSIISQGKVETIFQNKPEERRGMFEEVAGVLKYKTRKQEASRKLDKTQEHLNRVEDILFEINNQLTPLQRQKEKAEIYMAKRNELSQVDIALMVAEIDANNGQLQVVTSQVAQLEKQLAQKQDERVQYDTKIVTLRQQLGDIEQQLLALQDSLMASVQHVETLNGEQKVISERLVFSKQNKGQQDAAKFEKEEQLKQFAQELQLLETTHLEKEEQLKQLQVSLQNVKQKQNLLSENTQEALEDARQRYIDSLQLQTKYQNELEQAQRYKEQLTQRLNRLMLQKEQVQHDKTQLNSKVTQQQKELDELVVELDNLTQQYQDLQNKLKKMQYDKHDCDNKLANKQQLKQQLQAKLFSLKELSDDYAGYYQGVREILKQKTTIDGIHGSVAELIQVKKEYETAIDIALGASLQHVVVRDEKVATQAIAYLKQKRLGRATFLPLTIIKSRVFPSDMKHQLEMQKGYIGLASDLVQTQYDTIVSNLLGTTIVCDTIQSANKIAKSIQYRYRVVTIDGEVVHVGGSMTGGAIKQKNTSLLSRQADLDALTQQVKEITKELEVLQDEASRQNEMIVACQNQLNEWQQLGTSKRLNERELSISLEQNNEQAKTLDQQEGIILLDIKQIEQELDQNKEDYKTFKQQSDDAQKTVLQLRTLMSELSASQEEKVQQIDQLQQQSQQLTTNLAILKEQVGVSAERKRVLVQSINDVKLALNALSVTQNETTQTRELLQEELEQIKVSLAQELTRKDSLDEQLKAQRELKKDVDVNLEVAENQLKDTQYTIQQLLKTQGTLQGKIERYNVTIDTHLARLSSDYELTYEGAKLLAPLHMPISEASTFVSRLKREIEQLGPVNLEAIAEYDSTLERFNFMSEQQSDLLQAKDNLLSTMSEMDKEVEKRFSETFYAIKGQFEKTFPKLFGGGRATLELSDPTNLLETGIDIIAQPPGKRLQNLSLLSGGERAFTAIALLFAILEVKPVPFCLLDEVEAALDEANVSRYGRYLKSFTEQTQFIVITHRKGTMEEADVLYGVTMQESGVSKLASVKMEDYH